MAIRKRNGPLPDEHPFKGATVVTGSNKYLIAGLKRLKEQRKKEQAPKDQEDARLNRSEK